MKFVYLLFCISIILQPIAQIMEKKGMNQIGAIQGFATLFEPSTLFKIITNPYILSGVTCSFMGLVVWLGILSNLKVSHIYPFGAVSYIILAVLSTIFLGESISSIRWVGIGVIVCGCFLINM